MAEKCPKCGAEGRVCGSVRQVGTFGERFIQSDACRIRQLEARVAELEAELTKADDFLDVFVKLLKGDG